MDMGERVKPGNQQVRLRDRRDARCHERPRSTRACRLLDGCSGQFLDFGGNGRLPRQMRASTSSTTCGNTATAHGPGWADRMWPPSLGLWGTLGTPAPVTFLRARYPAAVGPMIWELLDVWRIRRIPEKRLFKPERHVGVHTVKREVRRVIRRPAGLLCCTPGGPSRMSKFGNGRSHNPVRNDYLCTITLQATSKSRTGFRSRSKTLPRVIARGQQSGRSGRGGEYGPPP